MSDSQKELRIKIITAAEMSGMREVEQSLQKQIGKAKALGQEYAALAQQLSEVQTRIKDAGGKIEEGGKKAGFFGLKLGELKRITRELGEQFPVAGKAAQFMLNPVVATFTIAIAIFAAAKEALKEWNQVLDESAEKAANPRFLAALEARKNALEAGKIAGDAFADKLQFMTDIEERYQQSVRDSIEATKEQSAAEQALADSKHEFDSGLLKQQLNDGLISEAQYYEKLTAMEIKYEQDKVSRIKKEHADEIAALQQMVAMTRSAQEQDKGITAAARTSATTARAKAESDAQQRDDLKTTIAADEKEKRDVMARLTDAGVSVQGIGDVEAGKDNLLTRLLRESHPLDIEKLLQLNREIESNKGAFGKVNARLPGEEEDEDAEKRRLARLEERVEHEQQTIEQTIREIAQKTTQYGFADKTAENAAMDAVRKKLQEQGIGGDGYTGASIEEAADLERRRAAFNQHKPGAKPLNEAENKFLDKFEAFAHITGGIWDPAQQLMATMISDAKTKTQQIKAMQEEMDRIRHLTNQLPQVPLTGSILPIALGTAH